MIIECNKCNKKFNVDESLIPENGRLLKCSNCENTWFYSIKEQDLNKFQNDDVGDVILNKNNSDINENNNTLNEEKINFDNDQNKKINKKNDKLNLNKLLKYLLIFIISFLGLLILIDTFKLEIANYFPHIIPILNNFYETFFDLKLFFKDLIY